MIDSRLPDPRPLIYLWDKYGYVAELTKFWIKNGLFKPLEIYVSKINAKNTAEVCATLLDE